MTRKIKHTTLDNGFKIIYAKDDSNPIISLQLFIRMGSNQESKEESGFSHLTEHLVFKSTENYPENGVMEKASYLGANINAYTEYDSTCHYLTLASKYTDQGIELLAELAQKADFSDDEFETEKLVVIEELKQYANDIEENFIESIPQHVFDESPYHNPIIGNLENLENSTPEKLREFYKKHYAPNNSFLVVSGSFKKKEITKKIIEHFGDWEPVERASNTGRVNKYSNTFKTVNLLNEEINQELLAFVIPEVSESHPDGISLSLATKTFSIGKNSKLYKRLYIEEHLVTSIQVHSISGIYNGVSIILVIPKTNSSLDKICRIFIEEFNSFKQQGMTFEELRKIKAEQEHGWKYAFEYVENLGSVLGDEELDAGYKEALSYPVKIAAINNSRIQEILDKYFTIDNLKIVHLGKKNGFLQKLEQDFSMHELTPITIPKKLDYHEHTLPSGMKLLLKRVVGKPTVGISLSRNISQLNESNGSRGSNFFTLGLMQHGNAKYSREALLDYCNERGINLQITNGIETSGVKLKCFGEYITESINLIADVIREPLFPESNLNHLKESVITNIKRVEDFPVKNSVNKFNRLLFGAGSNLISKTGDLEDIKLIDRSVVKQWHKEFLDLSQMTIAVVGDIHFDNVIRATENAFNFAFEKSALHQVAIFNKNTEKFKSYDFNNDQSIIHIGGYACKSIDYKQNVAFHVLSQIIGGEINSRLFNILREQLGIAYSVGFDYSAVKDVGFFTNFAIVDSKREKKAIEAITKIMEDVKKSNVTKEELEITKNYISGQRLLDNESVFAQANSLAILNSLGYPYEFYLTREERLQNVSHQDIKELAEEYFIKDKLYTQIYR